MKKRLVLFLAFCMLLVGCAQMRQVTVDLAQEETLNYEAGVQVAELWLKTWPFTSGAIRGVLGKDADRMTKDLLDTINGLDTLHAKISAEGDDDYWLGFFFGHRLRLRLLLVKQGLEEIQPGLMKAFPVLAGL